MSRNLRGLSEREGVAKGLFSEISAACSGPDDERDPLLKDISGRYLTGSAAVLSTASFYDFLTREHQEKKVFVCNGTACLASGASERVRTGLRAGYHDNEIGSVSCLGHCHRGDAFLAGSDVKHLQGNDKQPGQKSESFPGHMNLGISAGKSVFMHFSYDLKDYYNLLNKFSSDVEPAFREIEESGLRGRGGAGFPLYIKLRTSAGEYASRKYVVCNADEGDPGAFSDKWLLDNRPHAILFGMAVTGLLIGAETGILYIRGEYPGSVRSVRRAIKEYERLGITMTGSNGKNFKFEFIISVGQGAYICGEETALLNSLEGLRPEVRTRPPFPATHGLFGKPTIISNVETFANLWFILKEGGKVFSALGTSKSKGTKLVSLDSGFNRPGVYEVEMGTALDKVLLELGGGTKYPVKAFQVGGPLGGIVPSFKTGELTVDFESFSNAGFLLGHAGVVSIPSEFPMIRLLAHLLEFTSFESCGKCFPCRLGTKRAFELLNEAYENGRRIDRDLFTDLLETLQLGSLCALGGGITLPVTNALTWFKEELSCFFTDYTQHP